MLPSKELCFLWGEIDHSIKFSNENGGILCSKCFNEDFYGKKITREGVDII